MLKIFTILIMLICMGCSAFFVSEPNENNYENSDEFFLCQVIPLTCYEEADIQFYLSQDCFVNLNVYTNQSTFDTTLVRKWLTQGQYKYTFDARGKSPGIYYYQLIASNNGTLIYYTKTKNIRVLNSGYNRHHPDHF